MHKSKKRSVAFYLRVADWVEPYENYLLILIPTLSNKIHALLDKNI